MILEKLCFQLMPDAHLGEAPQRAQMILRALGLSARVLTGDGDRPPPPVPRHSGLTLIRKRGSGAPTALAGQGQCREGFCCPVLAETTPH